MAQLPMTLLMTMAVMTSFMSMNEAVDPASATVENQPKEATTTVIQADQKEFRKCPPPYSHILGECFYIHMYIPLLTWQDAQTFCKQAGGILAEPKYFGAVIAQLYNEGMADKIFRRIFNRVWLGGHRVGNTTSFEWSSGRPIEDLVTEGDDPHFDDIGGDCILMKMIEDEPFQLRASSCNTKTHYVCQLP